MRRSFTPCVFVCLLIGCSGETDPPPIDDPPIDAVDAPDAPDAVDAPDAPDAPLPSELTLTPPPSWTDFGNVAVEQVSTAATFTLTNTGAGPAGAVTVNLSGAHAAEFSVGAPACNNLAPGANCDIAVVFAPTMEGTRVATLGVTAINGGDASVLLQGTGSRLTADLDIQPATFAFGPVIVGQPSSPAILTVRNVGLAQSGELSISLANGDVGNFQIEPTSASDCTTATRLAPNASCTVRTRFLPTTTGDKTVHLVVSATPGDTASAPLTGSGVIAPPAELTLAPSTAPFGTIVVGQASAPTVFTVTNIGGSTSTTITAVSSSPRFTIAPATDSCNNRTLGPTLDCTFTVVYTPIIAGGMDGLASDSGTITVAATAGGLRTAQVTGTGSAALSVGISAAGAAGNVTSSPAGIACSSGTCTAAFTTNTVRLTAAAGATSGFVGWMGVCAGVTGPICDVTMDAARTATAVFVPLRRLTVIASGGTVTSDPAGVSCPGDCTGDYNHGTSVTLTATPSAGYRFGSWSVAGCSGTTCTVSMMTAMTVTATFVRQYTLTVGSRDLGVSSSSLVTASPSVGAPATCTSAPGAGTSCTYVYDAGIDVVLSRTLGANTAFQGWTGDCSGTGGCGPLIMNADRTVDAGFASYRVVITIPPGSNGKVAIAPTASGALCPDDSCTPVFPGGTPVTLTPQPGSGEAFWGWSNGNCAGTGPCALTMDANKTATAEFRTARTLTLTKTGAGTVTSNPTGISCGTGCTSQSAAFPDGRMVTLSASPSAGYELAGWGGACANQTGTSCTVTMTAALGAGVTFVPGTDLVVTAVACTPDPVAPGGALACSVTVRNTGTTAASSFTNRLALSADAVIDGADLQLATCNVASLAAGAAATVNCNGAIPAGTVAGPYFAGVMADSGGAIAEVSESNNTASDPLTVARPDITVTSVACTPEPAAPGATIACEITFANSGPAVGAFTYDLRLSADAVIDTTAADPLIAGCMHAGGIPADSTATATCGGALPQAYGPYRTGVIADRGAAVTESNETNNTASAPIRIGTDLQLSALSCTDSVLPGGDATCTYTLTNLGAAVGPFTTTLRLSADGLIDENDPLVGSCHTAGLAVGETVNQSCTVPIPFAQAAGGHFLGATADSPDVIAEWDFSAAVTNNAAAERLVVTNAADTDLTASDFSCTPGLVAPNGAMSCSLTIINRGPVAAAASAITVRSSSYSGGVTPTSTPLGQCAVPGLAGGAATTVTCGVTAPGTPQVRYVAAFVDSTATILESAESNNKSNEMRFEIAGATADLVVATVVCPDPVAPNAAVSCDVTISNRGNQGTVPFANRIVRSTDATISTTDTAVADCNASNGIPALGTLTLQCPMTLTGFTPGTPYIGVLLDTGNNVQEVNDANNTGYDRITVAATGVDLDPDGAQLRCTADKVIQGGSVVCSVVVFNRGTSTAPASRTGLSVSGMPIGDCPTPQIPGLGSARFECLGTVPLGTPPGNPSVTAIADFNQQLTESNETNNADVNAATVTLNTPDLVAQSITCTSIGSAASCLVRIHNSSGVSIASHRLSIRQSADAIVDGNDPQVASCDVPALGPAAIVVHRCNVTLADGATNVGAIIDADAAVSESNEGNNLIAGTASWTLPNLSITLMTCTFTYTNGGTATCDVTVANTGTGPAGPFDITTRRSTNTIFDAPDVAVASVTVAGLAAGASQIVRVVGLTTHSGYIVGKVDNLALVPETDETNNTNYDSW